MDDAPWQDDLDAPVAPLSPRVEQRSGWWDEGSTSSTPLTPMDDAPATAAQAYLRLGIVGSSRESDAQGPYIAYDILIETNSPALEEVSQIRRRYGDFASLHAELRKEVGCIVPPLPPARKLEHVTGDRWGEAFVNLRQRELTLFLHRIARHPTLRLSGAFLSFLSPHWTGEHASSEWSWTSTPAALEGQKKALEGSRRDFEHLHRALQRERNEHAGHLFSLPNFPDPFAPALDLPPPDDLSEDYEGLAGSVQLLAALESGMAPALFALADGLRRMGALLTREARETDQLCHGIGGIIALLQAGEGAIARAGRLEGKIDSLQRSLDDRGVRALIQSGWDTLRGKEEAVQLERAGRRHELERCLAASRAELAMALDRLGDEGEEPAWLRAERDLELRGLLQAWTKSKVACREATLAAWDEVLDVLEAPVGA